MITLHYWDLWGNLHHETYNFWDDACAEAKELSKKYGDVHVLNKENDSCITYHYGKQEE